MALAHEQRKVELELERKALEEAIASTPEDEDEEIIISQLMEKKDIDDQPVFKPIFKSLLEHSVGIVVLIGAIGFILSAWDVNVGERGNPVTGFLDTVMIVFVSWFLYRLVVIYVDSQLEDEGIDPAIV